MRTLAIIGSHPRTKDKFDWARTDCDIWVFNEAVSNKSVPRADVVFQMHAEAIWRNPANRNDPGHADWLKKAEGIVIYMQDVYPDVPASRRYPLEDIMAALVKDDPNHFLTSSVPQAMALAAWMNCYERVEIWGVAMETNTEYQFQREGVAYWYGYLKGRGVEVYFADPTFEAPLYGYEGKVSVEYEQFNQRIAELTPQVQTVSAEYKAAMAEMNMALSRFIEESSADNEQLVYAIADKVKGLGDRLGFLDGGIQENEKYRSKADKMLAASGSFLISRQEFESAVKALGDKVNEEHVKFIACGTQLGNAHNAIRQAAKGSKKREDIGKIYRQILAQYLNINNQMAIYRGARDENIRYMLYLDKYIRAAGGSKSEAVLLEAQHV